MFCVITKWIVLSTLPVFFVFFLFPRQVIFLTYGSEYVAGDLALSVLVLGFLANIMVGPAEQTLSSIGDTQVIMYVSVFAASLNVVLNLVLIPRYSYVGAAVATSISYAVLHGLYLFQLYRRTGIHPVTSSMFKPIFAVTITSLFAYTTLDALVEITFLVMILACLAFAPVYVLLILRFGGIGREEVDLLIDLEHKLGVDLTLLKQIAKKIID